MLRIRQSHKIRGKQRRRSSQASRRRPCSSSTAAWSWRNTRDKSAGDSGFPESHEGGLGIGGQYGEGTLLKGGTAAAYYKTTGASFGLQAGGQTYGYAMFFMNAKALDEFVKASGFEVGVGPSVVLIDEGKAKTTTTTTMKDDIYAFVFGQKGLMAGLGIQGNKITRSLRSSESGGLETPRLTANPAVRRNECDSTSSISRATCRTPRRWRPGMSPPSECTSSATCRRRPTYTSSPTLEDAS